MNFDNQSNQGSGLVDRGSGNRHDINIVEPVKPDKPAGSGEQKPKPPVRPRGNKKAVMAVIAVAAIVCAIMAFVFNGSSESATDSAAEDSVLYEDIPEEIVTEEVAIIDSAAEVTDSVASTATEPETPEPAVKENPAPVKKAYKTGLGEYEGPKSGGVAHGIGTVRVTVTTSVTDFNTGGSVTVRPGDEIRRAKFVDGDFVQGELWRDGRKIALIGKGAI